VGWPDSLLTQAAPSDQESVIVQIARQRDAMIPRRA
jgi:hypothetical protein